MKVIEEYLTKFDKYCEDKKENEKWLIILGVAGIVSYIAFTSFLPIAESRYKVTELDKKALNIKINNNKNYLTSITKNGDKEFYIKDYNKKINESNKQIAFFDKEIKNINDSFNKLSDLLFNEKSWSKFLNSLSTKAEEEGLSVNYIKNKYVSSKGDFGHTLEISMGIEGNFKNIVSFINDIEQNKLVTDIYGSELSLDENSTKIVGDIKISVWGINN